MNAPSHPSPRTILHLISTLGGGGAERNLALLARESHANGTRVHVGYLQGGPHLETLRERQIPTHPLPHRSNYDARIILEIIRLIRQIRPTIIQTWLPQMDVLGGIAARLTGVPQILQERSTGTRYPNDWRTKLRIGIARRAAVIVANSHGGATYWQTKAPRTAVRIIPNGLDLAALDAAAPHTHLTHQAQGKPILVFAGRLLPSKNGIAFTNAVDEYRRVYGPVTAYILGDGPERRHIEAITTRQTGPLRTEVLGFQNDIWSYLKIATVFVSLSEYEGRPNAVLEAMAIGCPLIVSDIPAHREILDDRTARFVPCKDINAVAHAIHAALHDPSETARRAAQAQKWARQWSLRHVSDIYRDLYDEVTTQTR